MKKYLTEEARVEAINRVIEKMIGGRKPRAARGSVSRSLLVYYREPSSEPVCYISTEGPTRHERKQEFEKDQESLEKLQQAIEALSQAIDNLSEVQRGRIEETARWQVSENLSPAKIAVMQGLLESQSSILEAMTLATEPEERRLSDENDKWWSRLGPKNFREHAIAKKIADLYVRECQKKPTCAIREGDVTGKFGQAHEEIFEICDFKVGFREPARVAINSITAAHILHAKRSAIHSRFCM